MAARGPYAKGVAKRAEILDAALAVIDEHGYTGATVKELADAVGLSQNGLLHYFGSKDALFLEIVRHHLDLVQVRIGLGHVDLLSDFTDRVVRAAADNIDRPGMSRLILNLAASASEESHLAHDYLLAMYAGTREITESLLTELQSRGRFPADGDPAAAAALLSASLDGLQLQWLYDDTVDVQGHLRYLLRALGIHGDESQEPS